VPEDPAARSVDDGAVVVVPARVEDRADDIELQLVVVAVVAGVAGWSISSTALERSQRWGSTSSRPNGELAPSSGTRKPRYERPVVPADAREAAGEPAAVGLAHPGIDERAERGRGRPGGVVEPAVDLRGRGEAAHRRGGAGDRGVAAHRAGGRLGPGRALGLAGAGGEGRQRAPGGGAASG
jgi:hypothetical protein